MTAKRSNYIIQGRMQGKFTLTLLMLLFLIAVISFCNLYVIGSFVVNHYSVLQSASTPTAFIATAMAYMWPRLLLIIGVNIIIVVIIGVFYSHQFAGPSFKMERSLRQIASGDLSSKIYLRKGDSLHNVADAINQLIDNFRTVVRKTTDLSEQMKINAEKIDTDDEDIKKRLGTLKGISDEINELFARFTLDEQPTSVASGPDESEESQKSDTEETSEEEKAD